MYHIKDDQRAIRSSEMLYEGLAKLMQERDFHSIKVKDLVEVAHVGRTTFYRNFDAIEDVLRLRCDQVFEGLFDYFIDYLQKHQQESAILLRPLLRYFYLHSDIIELLMQANRIDMAQAAFLRGLTPFKAQFMALHDVDADTIDYAIVVRIGIVTNILTHWIATGKKQAPDDLADQLGAMITKMVTFDQLL